MIKTTSSIEDYYKSDHLPLGFFINNGGDGADNNVAAKERRALFGSGVGSGSGAQKASTRYGISKQAAKG